MDDLTKEFLIESAEGLDGMERCLAELQSGTDTGDCVAKVFRAVHTIKGTVGFLGFPRLERLAHAGEQLLAPLRDGQCRTSDGVLDGLVRLMDRLREVLHLIEITGGEGSRAADNDEALFEILERLAKEGAAPPDAASAFMTSDGGPLRKLEAEAPASTNFSINAIETTVRVDVETLNRLMNLVGELVQTRNQFLQSEGNGEGFARLGRRLDGVTASLRETVMRARLQPVGQLFQKFPRLVREVARVCGKNVRLEFSGGDTGLDKSLLEALKDPLTHAVRNAIDHGIERPEQRLLQGKPIEGKVHLRAFHEGGQVVVEVTDDGAGVGREPILRRAVERGLITPEHARGLSAAEAMELLFAPGFSTCDEVTMISGRGIGMDVVRANVEHAGGSVELHSVEGEGTTLRMRVPLTLAIVPALIARCGGQMFAVPHSALLEMVQVQSRDEAAAIRHIGNAKVFLLRGRFVPLLDLSAVLGIGSDRANGFYIAVLEAKGSHFGLVVDDMEAPQEIVVKPLSSCLSSLNVYSGATLLSDGRIALILDTAGVARLARLCEAGEGNSAAQPEERVNSVAGDQGKDLQRTMLLFIDHRGERAALPLECVERIEKIKRGAVEILAGHSVMQYRGELLALEDPGGLLQQDDAALAGKYRLALICRPPGHQGQRIGLVIRDVLDVAEGDVLPPSTIHAATVARVQGRLAGFYSRSMPQAGDAATNAAGLQDAGLQEMA